MGQGSISKPDSASPTKDKSTANDDEDDSTGMSFDQTPTPLQSVPMIAEP